jgi:RNA polymerase sigma-70 factor (ECF subfamily)
MNQEVTTNLSKWVEEYTSDLYKWAFYKISDSEQAKDLVQDTFLAAAEKIGSFKGESSPKTWLFSILNHKITDHYRKKVSQPIPLEDKSMARFFEKDGDWQESNKPKNWQDVDDNNLLDDGEFQAILKKCLDALPEKWSTSVRLKYLTEKNGEEICQELGITTSNFWQIVHRAKVQLRDCIEINWFKS